MVFCIDQRMPSNSHSESPPERLSQIQVDDNESYEVRKEAHLTRVGKGVKSGVTNLREEAIGPRSPGFQAQCRHQPSRKALRSQGPGDPRLAAPTPQANSLAAPKGGTQGQLGHRASMKEEEEEKEPAGASLGNLQQRTQSRIEKKVCEVVQFLLVKDQTKVPIKRTHIVNTITKEYKKITTEIINRPGLMLEQVFGTELKKADDKGPASLLLNKLEPLENGCMRPKHDTAKTGLLMVILNLIFTKGNSAKEAVVWGMLRKVWLHSDKKVHFGDVNKLVTGEFVRQRCLEYNRIPYTDPEEYEFLWGPRAFLETSLE
ncbi:LOW QUALITY PROTEIN: non-structural maintenance of chromosomes element 3 homolog [Dromiciops gliroides]|uniref:LOW QUALITY PROTEIN: non-structural maintenance of chromosomes element 3 homolog n=1 Tax=Dromiciops gliroides TaxID=33562 RepID=UPI001CC3FF20|nr:LOW QUALITY PROTEIN: non-structural maintenance of chromosomes element 3 homolog [Dromiciops gliroides]